MRAYSESREDALRARDFLKDWAGEDFISEAQYQLMEEETVCDLRRTSIFLRLVLFLFTLIVVSAAAGLFFVVFLQQGTTQTTGVFLLIFAAISYAAAEFAVSRARLYRYGIEEVLAVYSVGFLCVGIALSKQDSAEFLVPAVGAIASLWIWRRFGFPYAFLAAMISALWLPSHWTSSHSAQHLIVATIYTTGLIIVAAVRSPHRFTYLNEGYSIIEALLWLGVYLAINLQLSSVTRWNWQSGPLSYYPEFPKTFYWATWVLIWCLPPVILARGLRFKDRFVIAAGAIAAILTLITNKPYLGWPRHTWDPMLLGALLIGAALFIRRRLAAGPDGVRYGFTARRLSGKDKQWMSAGSAVLGFVSPQAITPSPQAVSPSVHFGGGDSAGGGATSDF